MRIYIIRHGEPDYPNRTITPAGHLEARALAEALADEKLDAIFCSPLGRAQHTAGYTAEKLKLPITTLDWLAELPLRCEGPPCPATMAWDVHGHILRRTHAARLRHDFEPERHYRADGDRPSAEILARLAAESDAFLAEMGYVREGEVYRVEKTNRRRIAVFCHGGLGLSWLAHLLMIPTELMWSGFWLATTSVTKVLMDERDNGLAAPRCLCVGDTGHLRAAGLPISPAGIKANID